MKKFLTLLTALSIAVSLCACGSNKDNEPDDRDADDSFSQDGFEKIPPLSDSVDLSARVQALLDENAMARKDAEVICQFDEKNLNSTERDSYEFVKDFLNENAEDWLIIAAGENPAPDSDNESYIFYRVWIEGREYSIAHLTKSRHIFTDYRMEALRAGIERVIDPFYPDLENSNVTLSISFEPEGEPYDNLCSDIGLFDWEDRDANPADILNERKFEYVLMKLIYPSVEDIDLDAFKTFQENVEHTNFYNCYFAEVTDFENEHTTFFLNYDSSTKTFSVELNQRQYLSNSNEDSSEMFLVYDALHYNYDVEPVDIKDIDIAQYRKVYEDCFGKPLDVPDEMLTAYKLTKHAIVGKLGDKTAEELSAGKDYKVVFEEHAMISFSDGFIAPVLSQHGDCAYFDATNSDSVIMVNYQ